jgi:hypothetical protein
MGLSLPGDWRGALRRAGKAPDIFTLFYIIIVFFRLQNTSHLERETPVFSSAQAGQELFSLQVLASISPNERALWRKIYKRTVLSGQGETSLLNIMAETILRM